MTSSDYYHSISQWVACGASEVTKGFFATMPLCTKASDDIAAEVFEDEEEKEEEDAVEDAIVMEDSSETPPAAAEEEEEEAEADDHESQDKYETMKLDKQPDKIENKQENKQSRTNLVKHGPCRVRQETKKSQQTISIGRVASTASTVSALSVPSVMSERSQFVRAMFEKDDGSISVFGDNPASRRGTRAKLRQDSKGQMSSRCCTGGGAGKIRSSHFNKVKPSTAPRTKSRNNVHLGTRARQLACAGGILTMNFHNESKGDFVKSHGKPCPIVSSAASTSMRAQSDSLESKTKNPVRYKLVEI